MVLTVESLPVVQSDIPRSNGRGERLLRTIIRLCFPMFVCAVRGMAITAFTLIRSLLLMAGDVEPNPGPPKRRGEQIVTHSESYAWP